MSAVPRSIVAPGSPGQPWHLFIAPDEDTAITVIGWAAIKVLRGRYGRVVERVAQEHVQEVVHRLMTGAARFNPAMKVGAFGFLCGVHRRVAQERERRQARDKSQHRLRDLWSLSQRGVGEPAESACDHEALEALPKFVSMFSPADQDLLRRRFRYPTPLDLEGAWSDADRVRLSRLLARLRDLMADYA